MRQYTPKQIEKYKRQKYISALNKCTKNLYKLYKDKNCDITLFKTKFTQLKDELQKYSDVKLNSEYFKRVRDYIDTTFKETVLSKEFDKEKFLAVREKELNILNRFQKMKNKTKYSKNKYKDSGY